MKIIFLGINSELIRVESPKIWERESSEMTSGNNPKFEMRLDETMKLLMSDFQVIT